jgi:hypothetical protein
MSMPVPAQTSEQARLVYKRFLFVLGCRWNHTHGEPMPFSQRFGAALTGLSPSQVWWETRELERLGLLERIGTTGTGRQQTSLWLPRGVRDLDAGSDLSPAEARRLQPAEPVSTPISPQKGTSAHAS